MQLHRSQGSMQMAEYAHVLGWCAHLAHLVWRRLSRIQTLNNGVLSSMQKKLNYGFKIISSADSALEGGRIIMFSAL